MRGAVGQLDAGELDDEGAGAGGHEAPPALEAGIRSPTSCGGCVMLEQLVHSAQARAGRQEARGAQEELVRVAELDAGERDEH